MRVLLDGTCLIPTGEYWNTSVLVKRWRDDVLAAIAASAESQADALMNRVPSPTLAGARKVMQSHGVFVDGDLLFVAGQPPRLGCLIPPHENVVVGAIAARQYAITTTLRFPLSATVTDFQVFRRGTTEQWIPFQHPLCLGDRGKIYIDDCPPLAVWAQLRWAAERIATNGRFHINDGADNHSEEPDYA